MQYGAKNVLLSPQNLYQNRPLELVRIIQNCLLKESELVKQHENINVSI